MGLFSEPRLSELLEREQTSLDEIFGEGAYQIESSDSDCATVRSARLKWSLGRDPRDGLIVSELLAVPGEPWEEQAITEVWARFLDEEIPPVPRYASGHVKLSAGEQIKRELGWVHRLTRAIFSDPQKARDAAFFVQGYQRAYDDYCSGSWDAD